MQLFENICVPRERSGLELDEFLCLLYPRVAKGAIRERIRDGEVLLDGMPSHPSQRLRTDEVVSLAFDPDELSERRPEAPAPEVDVLYEDDDILVVDKPPGIAVEPERWAREKSSLSDALLDLVGGRSDEGETIEFRPRLVHRIDKDTSGVVVAAKHLDAERALRSAFENGEVDKVYVALVEGEIPLQDGEEDRIEASLDADSRRSGRMRVVERGGKAASTVVSVERRFRGYTLARCKPITGRTHQIRVHLSDRGFPLAVDNLYGRRKALLLSEIKAGYRSKPGRTERPLIDRLTLHALEIELPALPGRERGVRVTAPLPRDFERVLTQLAKVRPPRR
jgi:RluA family pseudouridine synthase